MKNDSNERSLSRAANSFSDPRILCPHLHLIFNAEYGCLIFTSARQTILYAIFVREGNKTQKLIRNGIWIRILTAMTHTHILRYCQPSLWMMSRFHVNCKWIIYFSMDIGSNNHKPQSYHSCNYIRNLTFMNYLLNTYYSSKTNAREYKNCHGKIEERDYKKYKSSTYLIILKQAINMR